MPPDNTSPLGDVPLNGGPTEKSPELTGLAPELRVAARAWLRRGYTVHYHDTHLIQVVRRTSPGVRSLPWLIMAALALVAAIAAVATAYGRRPWHVVSLVIGPDRRILTHHHFASRPPEP